MWDAVYGNQFSQQVALQRAKICLLKNISLNLLGDAILSYFLNTKLAKDNLKPYVGLHDEPEISYFSL